MKIYTLLNHLQKVNKTTPLFVRATHYGWNELTSIRPIVVVPCLHGIELHNNEHYGRFRQAHSMDKDIQEGFELIHRKQK